MITSSHLEKFARLRALRGRLEPLDDFELWYWTTLTASTNALNAVLHHAGLTRPDPVFSTIPGVHVARQPDGRYARELRGLGDVSHVGWPPIDGDIPPDVASLMHAIECIEVHRDPCVRGTRAPTPEIARECEQAFAQVTAVLVGRFPEVQR
jgi:hypothetical protein